MGIIEEMTFEKRLREGKHALEVDILPGGCNMSKMRRVGVQQEMRSENEMGEEKRWIYLLKVAY